MAKTCLVDTPIATRSLDQLDISLYVDVLKEFLEGADTPLTVAIQGEWGSGKTSFMNQLSEELCTNRINSDKWTFNNPVCESPYFGIWIHAWEYALLNEPGDILINLMKGLIREIRYAVESVTPEDTDFKKYCSLALSITKKLAMATCYAAASHVNINASSVQKAFTDGTEEKEDANIGDLKKALRETISAALSAAPQKKGFIFFIDDLDRLDPVIAVNFLELVKNLFDLPNCIFILAIDYEVVVRGLTPRFGERTDKNEREFRSFFDKIIQVPFSVPTSSYDLRNYLKNSLDSIGFLTGKEKDVLIPLDGTFHFVHTENQDYSSNLRSALDIIAALTEYSTGNNPRSIKRLLNVLFLLNKIQEKKYEQMENTAPMSDTNRVTEKVILYALVCLQVAYPKLYEFLAADPGFTFWTEDDTEERGYKKLDEAEVALLEKRMEFDEPFEQVIYQICRSDSYLKARCYYISRIFNMLRGIILSSDHKTLFDTDEIENIELLEQYDITKTYEGSEDDEKKDDQEQDFTEEELEKLLGLMHDIIASALFKFLSISGSTSISTSPELAPENREETRKQRIRSDYFADFEEYTEALGKNHPMLPLFLELKEHLDATFPDLLKYEYKDDNRKTINIRPLHRKRESGRKRILLAITPMTRKGLRMRVETDYETLDITDSIAPVLENMPYVVEHFEHISTVSLEDTAEE